jgi:probable rRNA maturation factor
MTIFLENLQDKIAINDNIKGLLERAADYTFQFEEFNVLSEISILLVNNEIIRNINKEHRNIDKPTDVLSFPMVDMFEGKIKSDVGDFDLDENLLVLGDIVISIEMVESQAKEYGHSFERELAFLVTHGIYHLLGYDHTDKVSEKKMIEKQEMVLLKMRLPKNNTLKNKRNSRLD